MAATLNVAVLGLGRMGRVHGQILAQLPGVRIVAAADPDPQARAAFEAQFAVPHVLAEPAAALARPDVDAVVIATPTGSHRDLVIAAAGAKKAILCEKPLALTVADNRAAIAAVERAGVPLQVGFMRHFDAAHQRAKALIDSGQIGRPVTFKSVGRDPFCPNVAFADPALSGGLLIDMGIHDFDLARWLMGSEVTRVSGEGTLLVCESLRAVGDIDNAIVNFRYASGALGNVEVSRNAFYGYDIRTEILGSEGAVNIGSYQQTPVLLLTRAGAQHDVIPYLHERFGPAYRAQLEHFVACLRDGAPPAVGGPDALAALAIGLAGRRSIETGQPVELADVL